MEIFAGGPRGATSLTPVTSQVAIAAAPPLTSDERNQLDQIHRDLTSRNLSAALQGAVAFGKQTHPEFRALVAALLRAIPHAAEFEPSHPRLRQNERAVARLSDPETLGTLVDHFMGIDVGNLPKVISLLAAHWESNPNDPALHNLTGTVMADVCQVLESTGKCHDCSQATG